MKTKLLIYIWLALMFGSAPVAALGFTFIKDNNESTHYFSIPQTTKPVGAKTQWMQFWFYSGSFFSNSPNSHFAAAIRGGISSSGATGRGMTIGHTHLISSSDNGKRGGCTEYASLPDGYRPGMSQIESFWIGGNYVYKDTCRPFSGYNDNEWYRVTIHANDGGGVAFWVDDQFGKRIDAGYEPWVNDSANPVPAGRTGLWIAFARGHNERGYWAMYFYDIKYGWY